MLPRIISELSIVLCTGDLNQTKIFILRTFPLKISYLKEFPRWIGFVPQMFRCAWSLLLIVFFCSSRMTTSSTLKMKKTRFHAFAVPRIAANGWTNAKTFCVSTRNLFIVIYLTCFPWRNVLQFLAGSNPLISYSLRLWGIYIYKYIHRLYAV